MSTFIYGTVNPAKLAQMKNMLEPLDVKIIGLKETGIAIPEANENGRTPLDNARIKALAYYGVLKRPIFACDTGLYIDGLPEIEQPGVHVRMVGGKHLSDAEMTAHYAAIAKGLGGRAVARYRNAICLIMRDGEIYEYFGEDIASTAFYIVDAPHAKRVEGFPLDCLSVDIQTGKYYYDKAESRSSEDSGQASGFRVFFEKVIGKGVIL